MHLSATQTVLGRWCGKDCGRGDPTLCLPGQSLGRGRPMLRGERRPKGLLQVEPKSDLCAVSLRVRTGRELGPRWPALDSRWLHLPRGPAGAIGS